MLSGKKVSPVDAFSRRLSMDKVSVFHVERVYIFSVSLFFVDKEVLLTVLLGEAGFSEVASAEDCRRFGARHFFFLGE